MSKGYILVDMPKSCRDCEFFGFVCRITNEKCEYYNEDGRPDWCPIRELPEKRRVMGIPGNPSIGDFERVAYQRGWNDCIERMEVEE